MGMMTRRNVKARGIVVPPAVVTEEVKAVEVKTEEVKEPELSLNEKVKAKGLSKTDINRMTTAVLQKLADELGMKDAEEMSGSKIKRLLINALEG